MNWDAISKSVGSAFGAVNPFLGTLQGVGAIFGQKQANKDMIALAHEQMAHQYKMQQSANAFTEKMWNLNNAYNSPSSQMARFKDAGLNPNLMYGGMQSLSPQSPSGAIAPQGSSPILGNPFDQASISQMLASARLMNSQAAKADVETQREYTFAQFDEQLLSGKVTMQNVDIEVGRSVKDMNEAQKTMLYKRVNEIDANIKNLGALTSLNNALASKEEANADIAWIERSFANRKFGAIVSDLENRAKISRQEASTFMQSFTSLIMLRSSMTGLNNAAALKEGALKNFLEKNAKYVEQLGINAEVTEGQLRLDLALNEKYSEADRIVGILKECTASLKDVLSMITSIASMGTEAAKTVVGFAK